MNYSVIIIIVCIKYLLLSLMLLSMKRKLIMSALEIILKFLYVHVSYDVIVGVFLIFLEINKQIP